MESFPQASFIVHETSPGAQDPAWSAVVGDGFIALVDAFAERSVIDALWERGSRRGEAATMEHLVGVIPIAGDHAVESFAIVVADDSAATPQERDISVIVRGHAVVDVFEVGGSRRVSSGGVEPWLLSEFRGVIAVSLAGSERNAGATPSSSPRALPVQRGVVRTDAVLWSSQPVLASVPDLTHWGDTVVSVRQERKESRERGAATPQEDDGIDDDTIVTIRGGASTSGTILAMPAALEMPATPASPAALGAGEPFATPAAFTITFPGSLPRPLASPTVIGRRPSAIHSHRSAMPTLIPVPSANQIVSSSHVRITVEGTVVVITDLRSRNGTFVTVPRGPRRRLRPGESFVVPHAATVDIGDGNIIEITPVSS